MMYCKRLSFSPDFSKKKYPDNHEQTPSAGKSPCHLVAFHLNIFPGEINKKFSDYFFFVISKKIVVVDFGNLPIGLCPVIGRKPNAVNGQFLISPTARPTVFFQLFFEPRNLPMGDFSVRGHLNDDL